MKKTFEKIKAIFEKIPIVSYILGAFIKSLLISSGVVIVGFGAFWALGIYSKLETALDLKYNSPIVLVPLWTFAALFVLCFVVGFLMYYYKYKRSKTKTVFYKALASILNDK